MPLIYGFIVLGLITLLLHISDKRKETGDDRRTKKLIARAKRDFPHNAMTESLGDLHRALYEEIVLANIKGKSIERLRHDRDLVAAEVNRLWQEEIDRNQEVIETGSTYRVSHTHTHVTPRHEKVRSSAPRTSSLVSSD